MDCEDAVEPHEPRRDTASGRLVVLIVLCDDEKKSTTIAMSVDQQRSTMNTVRSTTINYDQLRAYYDQLRSTTIEYD